MEHLEDLKVPITMRGTKRGEHHEISKRRNENLTAVHEIPGSTIIVQALFACYIISITWTVSKINFHSYISSIKGCHTAALYWRLDSGVTFIHYIPKEIGLGTVWFV